jgi:hypothetical protein
VARFADYKQESCAHFLYKPDSGSLGQGIRLIETGDTFKVPKNALAVVQELIPSYLIDNRKFDLRVYALLAGISPLRLYVYRDGVARFCSEESTGSSVYSYLTNISLNKKNTRTDFSKISRLISEILPILRDDGVDTQRLWHEIDEAIALTVLSAHKYLSASERDFAPRASYPRCFQILGFDILLDRNAHPWVLEVNYRPLLDAHRPAERRMKTQLVKEAVNLACPLYAIQEVIDQRKGCWDEIDWLEFLRGRTDLSERIAMMKILSENSGNFHLVYPTQDEARKQRWRNIYSTVHSMEMKMMPGLMIPNGHIPGGES